MTFKAYKYKEPRLKRHRFREHLAYNVRYPVLTINSSFLATVLYSSIITTLVYNDTNYSVHFITL